MSSAHYAVALRGAVRGLWIGEYDSFSFTETMASAIHFHLRRAWNYGLKQAGIEPEEMSDRERAEMEARITHQYQYIGRLRDFIIPRTKANGGLLRDCNRQLDLWIRRYDEMIMAAHAMAAGDQKMMWILGLAEHCRSCLKLSGKVKRASYWHQRGILPRQPNAWYLECKGFFCACSLVPTTDRASPGPLPSLP